MRARGRGAGGRAAALHGDILGGRKAFIGLGCAYGCNTLESIIMTVRRRARRGLWMMMAARIL